MLKSHCIHRIRSIVHKKVQESGACHSLFALAIDGILKIKCKNCHFMIGRGGPSVALDKEGCEIPQDLEILFRELNIH
jgi:hypothetical protein